jgi:hypothetical protein
MHSKTNRFLILATLFLLPLYAQAGELDSIFGQAKAMLIAFVTWIVLLFIFFKFLNHLVVSNTWRGLVGILGFMGISYGMIYFLDFLIHQSYRH